MTETTAKRPFLYRALDFIEYVGNKLPHPATLFALFAVGVIFLSWIFSELGISALHPSTGALIEPINLLSGEGIRRISVSLVTNFTGFAPLGTVLVALLGVGLAEGSGMIGAALRAMVLSAPKRLITMVIVFAGILSNTASEAGYVILVPLGAIIFMSVGRHPLAGMAAAFAGVSGGYSANLLLGTVDPLLSGISTEAAHILDPAYDVNPAANYYFMFASTFLLTAAGTIVTEKIVEPRLGTYGEGATGTIEKLSALEKKGLLWAGVSTLLFVILLAFMIIPEGAVLRDPATGGLLNSPFLKGIVAIIFAFFLIPGLAYGIATKSVKNDSDAVDAMSKQMSALGSYIVLVFFAAQFVAFFNWTNLGIILAIDGAEFLKSIGLTGIPLMLAFIVVAAILNLFMGSASAKWAIMAPVFIPMFMLLGYSPELTQVLYRIGDSTTNIVTPMMSYFALIVAFSQQYKKDAGIGTIMAMMLPYTFVFLIMWAIFLMGWIALDIPVGPGAPLYLDSMIP